MLNRQQYKSLQKDTNKIAELAKSSIRNNVEYADDKPTVCVEELNIAHGYLIDFLKANKKRLKD